MPSKRVLRLAALVAILFAVGVVSAADRDGAIRATARNDVVAKAPQVQFAGPASVTQILRLRLLETVRLLKTLQNTDSDPASFGTNGLSDGPDPIDAAAGSPIVTGAARKRGEGSGASQTGGEDVDQNSVFGPR